MSRYFDSVFIMLWRGPFFRRLYRQLRLVNRARARWLTAQARATSRTLLDTYSFDASNRQARTVFGLCSMILGSYRALLAECEPALAHELVRRACLGTHRRSAQLFARLALFLSRDPVASLGQASLVGSMERVYGRMVQFDQRGTTDGLELLVTHCGYHQFFLEQGEPGLARIVCEWDRGWMDAVNRSGKPVWVDRPEAISTGSRQCSFRFVRRAQGTASGRDVVLARGHEIAGVEERQALAKSPVHTDGRSPSMGSRT